MVTADPTIFVTRSESKGSADAKSKKQFLGKRVGEIEIGNDLIEAKIAAVAPRCGESSASQRSCVGERAVEFRVEARGDKLRAVQECQSSGIEEHGRSILCRRAAAVSLTELRTVLHRQGHAARKNRGRDEK